MRLFLDWCGLKPPSVEVIMIGTGTFEEFYAWFNDEVKLLRRMETVAVVHLVFCAVSCDIASVKMESCCYSWRKEVLFCSAVGVLDKRVLA